jgi:predicted nucleic acid-binding protein
VIAVDSSTLIAFFQGDSGTDVDLLDRSIDNDELVLPPVVVTEILSDAKLPRAHEIFVKTLTALDLKEGFWLRAGTTRSKLLARKLRARLADSLIAQSCIDHDIALITRDADFRHFAKHCGLKLA